MDSFRHLPAVFKRAIRFPFTNRLTTGAAAALSGGHAAVFYLHRFTDSPSDERLFPLNTLERCFQWLRAHHFRVVGLPALVHDLLEGRGIPPRTVAFTVDDGYADFIDLGLPLFRRYDVPATVFLVTDFIDRKQWLWWDRIEASILESRATRAELSIEGELHCFEWPNTRTRHHAISQAIERVKFLPSTVREQAIRQLLASLDVTLPALPSRRYTAMSWDQVRAAASDLISFGPHTRTHPILSMESDAVAQMEVTESWRRIQEELPSATPIFCFPNGGSRSFGIREVKYIAESGLLASLSTAPQYVRARDFVAPGDLARIPLTRYSLEADFGRFLQVASGVERFKQGLMRRFLGASTADARP